MKLRHWDGEEGEQPRVKQSMGDTLMKVSNVFEDEFTRTLDKCSGGARPGHVLQLYACGTKSAEINRVNSKIKHLKSPEKITSTLRYSLILNIILKC